MHSKVLSHTVGVQQLLLIALLCLFFFFLLHPLILSFHNPGRWALFATLFHKQAMRLKAVNLLAEGPQLVLSGGGLGNAPSVSHGEKESQVKILEVLPMGLGRELREQLSDVGFLSSPQHLKQFLKCSASNMFSDAGSCLQINSPTEAGHVTQSALTWSSWREHRWRGALLWESPR